MTFLEKLINHRNAYENINLPVPPYRATIQEWKEEFNKLKHIKMNGNPTWADIKDYMGVEIELVLKLIY